MTSANRDRRPHPHAQHEARRQRVGGARNVSETAAIDKLFQAMVQAGASDLHLSVGSTPMIRKDGQHADARCGGRSAGRARCRPAADTHHAEKNRQEFADRHDTDFAYEIRGLGTFPVHGSQIARAPAPCSGLIPTKILTAEQLGLRHTSCSSASCRKVWCWSPVRPGRASRPRSPR